MSSRKHARAARGATLIELMVTVGVYSFLVVSLFALTRDGTKNWRAIESRANVQASMRTAERDIGTELQRASRSSIVIDQSTYKHAILMKSAMNDQDSTTVLGDPLYFIVDNTKTPVQPKWQRWVMYYVTRIDSAEHANNYGFVCANPSGTSDDICPHKVLVRKDIYLSASEDTAATKLLDTSNHIGNPFVESSEPTTQGLLGEQAASGQSTASQYIKNVKILARDVLSFNLGVFKGDGTTTVALTNNKAPSGLPVLIEFDLKAFKMTEATQYLHVGTDALVTYKDQGATGYQTATAPFSIQLDNRVMPQNP